MVLFLLVSEAGWLGALDRYAYHLGARYSSDLEAHDDIVVVAIDDKSLKTLGAWPWSRDKLAEATTKIAHAKPRVTGFNMPFDMRHHEASLDSITELKNTLIKEKKFTRRVNKAWKAAEATMRGDQKMATAFKAGGRIVLSMPYIESTGPDPDITPSLPGYMQKFSLSRLSGNLLKSTNPDLPESGADRVKQLYPPIEMLASQVGGIGVVGFRHHQIGEPLVVRYGRDYLPSFELMMATRSKGLSMQNISSKPGERVLLGDKELATDINFNIYPRFYEDINGTSAFKIYSLVDILDETVKTSVLRKKIVLIGLTSERYARPRLTASGQSLSPTLAMAHSISSLLNGDLYHLPDQAIWAQRGMIISVGLYLMFLLARFRISSGFFLSLFLVLMIFNAHFILMSAQATWLPMMSVALMLAVGQLIHTSRQFFYARMKPLQQDLSSSNIQLGQLLQAQGNFDQAFEKFRNCHVDDSLLNQIYNLGLDYERKRQFHKAVAVFRYIREQRSDFSDVNERIRKNDNVANTVVLGGGRNSERPTSLIIDQHGVQKPKLGRYELESEIGRGAMGMVYLGRDEKIGRTVAVKTMMISDEIEEHRRDEVKERFFREAEAAGRLDHPNIVTIYDVGDEQDLAYIAMDYLKGKDLQGYCKPGSLLPASRVFEIIMSVAMALDYAHQQHVVHRDIKPANIIYDGESRSAKLTDFGVACLTDASKTKTGTVLGSPYYMSPEQLAGKKVDGRSDLFSLGVTLYQMLTGVLPFGGDSMANLMYNIANEKHKDIRQLKPEYPTCVSRLINKALHKEISKRFQSGKQMANSLRRCYTQVKEAVN